MRRDWTAGPIAVALCAALVAAGALWLLWATEPVLTVLAASWAALTGLCVTAVTRDLRARLEDALRLVDAYNSSEARDDLASVGPVSPPAGTRRVELFDQDAPWRLNLPAGEGVNWHTAEAGARHAGPVAQCDTCAIFVGHLTVPDGATGWLGPEDITFTTPDPQRLRIVGDREFSVDVEMTVAETDRLVAQLQALPGEELAPPRHNMFAGRPILNVGHGGTWHLGQPCHVCDAPATKWVSDRPDPEISDVTFLCDRDYAAAMSEENGRG